MSPLLGLLWFPCLSPENSRKESAEINGPRRDSGRGVWLPPHSGGLPPWDSGALPSPREACVKTKVTSPTLCLWSDSIASRHVAGTSRSKKFFLVFLIQMTGSGQRARKGGSILGPYVRGDNKFAEKFSRNRDGDVLETGMSWGRSQTETSRQPPWLLAFHLESAAELWAGGRPQKGLLKGRLKVTSSESSDEATADLGQVEHLYSLITWRFGKLKGEECLSLGNTVRPWLNTTKLWE